MGALMSNERPNQQRKRVRHDRTGKSCLVVHMDKDAVQAFRQLADETFGSRDAMLHKAVALLFTNFGRPVPRAIKRKLKEHGLD